jgi:cytochrome c
MNLLILAAACALPFVVAARPAPPADPANGQKLYARCVVCHSMNPTDRRPGPTLKGVVGREAGQVAGYAYSPAMKAARLAWTSENLDRFLAAPAKTVPANKMIYPPVTSASDRADIIAYLAANP